MQKEPSKIWQTILTIVFIPLMLLIGIGFVLYTPIDYIQYRRTQFYKDTRVKYSWLATISCYVRLYDQIQKADLPIAYIPSTDAFISGYFLYKNHLIIPDYPVCYDDELGDWTVGIEDDSIRVSEAVKQDIQECNEYLKAEVVNRAVILLEDEFNKDELSAFENGEFLLAGQSDTITVLKQFIADHP